MKKILFPFKINSDNQSAFVHAVRISRKMKAQLALLNTFLLDVSDDITKERYKELLAAKRYEAFRKVMELKERYLVDFLNLKGDLTLNFSYSFIHGIQKHILDEIFIKQRHELVVFTNDKDEKLLAETLNSSRDHVLVIPEGIAYRNIKRIAYAADFNKVKHAMAAVNYSMELAGLLDAEITFIHVNLDGGSDKIKDKNTYEAVRALCGDNAGCTFEILSGNDIFEAINRFISDKEVDLVAIVKRQKNFLEGMFHQSITKKISIYSKIPVLVLMEGGFEK